VTSAETGRVRCAACVCTDGDAEATDGGDTQAEVVTYPALPEQKTSTVFRVLAGTSMADQDVWTEELEQNRTIHYANFSVAGTVKIRVEVANDFESVQISPKSRHLEYTRDGNAIEFEITEPEKLILFFDQGDGDELDPLYIAANPLEVDLPSPDAEGVTCFGPGIHEAGRIDVADGDTVYIAGGAIVIGRFESTGSKNVTIRGRGILQESDGNGHSIRFDDCQDLLVEGITIRDVVRGWVNRIQNCDGVKIGTETGCSTRTSSRKSTCARRAVPPSPTRSPTST